MDLNDTQIKTIEMLAKSEETMSKLYTVYAEKFPDMHSFWSALSADELDHSEWIHKLSYKMQEGAVYFSEGRFKIDDIRALLDLTEDALAQSQKQEMSSEDSLALALYIEQTLMERKFFEVFETDSGELRQTLFDLDNAVRQHREKIEKALTEKKQS